MRIRTAAPTDIPQLVQMRWDFTAEFKEVDPRLFTSFSEECGEFLEKALEGDRWQIWVAEDDGRLVSHIFLQIVDTVPRPGRQKCPFGYVTNVYTVPSYRSHGIGGRIIEEVSAWAKDNNMELLIVWPSEQSVNFYCRHGFTPSKEVLEKHRVVT